MKDEEGRMEGEDELSEVLARHWEELEGVVGAVVRMM